MNAAENITVVEQSESRLATPTPDGDALVVQPRIPLVQAFERGRSVDNRTARNPAPVRTASHTLARTDQLQRQLVSSSRHRADRPIGGCA